jgi:hypothetical protein
MKVHLFNSSSAGNSFALESNNKLLILEAGIKLNKLLRHLKKIEYDISDIEAVLISHEHKDHSGFVKEYHDHGLQVFCSDKVRQIYDLHHSLLITNHFSTLTFKIAPLKGYHDVESYLFYIESKIDHENCFFIIDSVKTDALLCDLNHIIIEANYSDDLIIGKILGSKYLNRVINSHMSLENAIKYVNDSVKNSEWLPKVYLVHLSDNNSHQDFFIEKFKKETGIMPKIAAK